MLRKFITQIPFNIKLSFISFFSFILIFNIWRLVFLYFYIDDFNASPFLYLQSFYFGYTLDAILASILTLPINLASLLQILASYSPVGPSAGLHDAIK